ncbi:hypothetical protein [Peribacillus alkalitolerans]|uniref:tubby C-terminal domain-like protein n=1 Tax=Peribacillus alkalitolerans TaxID=1550385 RepID=UPI0013D84308|nr:hypothetical protein [Peribacillus alkalitolerans]
MQKYTYAPPMLKPSIKMIDVIDDQGNVVCNFKRTYKNFMTKIGNYIFDIDWSTQIDVYTNDRDIVYQCKKLSPWFGKPSYIVINCKTNEDYKVSYKSWQKVAPEFRITNNSSEFIVKKELMDWARFYHQGKEVARWKMKSTELFKTYLEIERECPIQEPEFFVCLFQCIFFVGD